MTTPTHAPLPPIAEFVAAYRVTGLRPQRHETLTTTNGIPCAACAFGALYIARHGWPAHTTNLLGWAAEEFGEWVTNSFVYGFADSPEDAADPAAFAHGRAVWAAVSELHAEN